MFLYFYLTKNKTRKSQILINMRWTLKTKPDNQKIKVLANQLNVDEIIASLLIHRGVETYEQARHFFRPSLDELHDPFLMKDMDKAVARIENAIKNNESILVYGDYDVDGTTAVSLVSSYLRSTYPNVATYIPDRYNEGYGISFKGIDFAEDNGISLIIALDCGIKSIDHVNYAIEKNIDFIICDHHRPGTELPNAIAVLDPKREDCFYPYDELCGCGIGFKLIHALTITRGGTINDITKYLDLVSIAIAADIVPVNGENRILAKFGLEIIISNPRPGIKALIQSANKKVMTITDVVFVIAPRINAAGRIKHGNAAVSLLTEYNLEQAEQFASEIENHNTERKAIDKLITAEALAQIEQSNEKERYSTVVYNEKWHKGVIGIVASRLIETYYRPTIVFTKSDDKLAASARSVGDFDIYKAIDASSAYLEQFGGHKFAAGMTLKPENYQNFKDAFEKVVAETIQPGSQTPEIQIDAEINFTTINEKFIRILKQFEPFGPENMSPVFLTKNIENTGFGEKIGHDKTHIKLFLNQGNSKKIQAIGFSMVNKLDEIKNKSSFDALYCISENEFKGNVTLQLRLKDLR